MSGLHVFMFPTTSTLFTPKGILYSPCPAPSFHLKEELDQTCELTAAVGSSCCKEEQSDILIIRLISSATGMMLVNDKICDLNYTDYYYCWAPVWISATTTVLLVSWLLRVRPTGVKRLPSVQRTITTVTDSCTLIQQVVWCVVGDTERKRWAELYCKGRCHSTITACRPAYFNSATQIGIRSASMTLFGRQEMLVTQLSYSDCCQVDISLWLPFDDSHGSRYTTD